MAWLRILTAAVVFAFWRRERLGQVLRDRVVLAWAVVLAAMNCCFYTAIDRLPLATVAAIEFLPVVGLAALGARTPRNVGALALAVPGVYVLTGVHLAGEATGIAFAFANALLFAAYIVCADRAAKEGLGIDGLAGAMVLAAIFVTPVGATARRCRLDRSPAPGWASARPSSRTCSTSSRSPASPAPPTASWSRSSRRPRRSSGSSSSLRYRRYGTLPASASSPPASPCTGRSAGSPSMLRALRVTWTSR